MSKEKITAAELSETELNLDELVEAEKEKIKKERTRAKPFGTVYDDSKTWVYDMVTDSWGWKESKDKLSQYKDIPKELDKLWKLRELEIRKETFEYNSIIIDGIQLRYKKNQVIILQPTDGGVPFISTHDINYEQLIKDIELMKRKRK